MKVIELLQRIANGEEVPKKIKVSSFETGTLYKEEDYIDYEVFWKDCDGDEHSYWLFDKPTYNDKLNQTIEILNDKNEIIEEDKKIEELFIRERANDILIGRNEKISYATSNLVNKELADKINEIIDFINGSDKE